MFKILKISLVFWALGASPAPHQVHLHLGPAYIHSALPNHPTWGVGIGTGYLYCVSWCGGLDVDAFFREHQALKVQRYGVTATLAGEVPDSLIPAEWTPQGPILAKIGGGAFFYLVESTEFDQIPIFNHIVPGLAFSLTYPFYASDLYGLGITWDQYLPQLALANSFFALGLNATFKP